MHVIDAKTMSPDPVAVVDLPSRVPPGFHALFVTEVSVLFILEIRNFTLFHYSPSKDILKIEILLSSHFKRTSMITYRNLMKILSKTMPTGVFFWYQYHIT